MIFPRPPSLARADTEPVCRTRPPSEARHDTAGATLILERNSDKPPPRPGIRVPGPWTPCPSLGAGVSGREPRLTAAGSPLGWARPPPPPPLSTAAEHPRAGSVPADPHQQRARRH